ncbi:MAG TPA: thioredoxin domain-containing protein [Pyrinomonadaceae bacterium]|jgi:protein-disulfide isomerase
MKQTTKLFTFFLTLALFALSLSCKSSTTNNTNGVTKTPNTGAKTPSVNTGAIQRYQNAPAGAQPANMLGSPTASVTVEEFADFQCPSCAQVHTIMKNIQSAYGNRINFVYRHFPLSQLHKNAYDASLAAEAAGQQNRFWDMQNQLFTNQQSWATSPNPRQIFVDYAQKMGLDIQRFQSDMIAMPTKLRVDADIKRGNALALDSTPSLFINGNPVPFQQMNVDALRAMIDAELQKGGNNQTQAVPPTAPAGNTTANTTTNTTAANTSNSAANTGNAANAANAPAKK